MKDFRNTFLTIPEAIILGALLISISILISNGVIKLDKIKFKNVLGTNKSVSDTSIKSNEANQVSASPGSKSLNETLVSVDDDPVFGDGDAKVTIIEFSDYECPFCKRYFDQTLPQIKSEYIDTGKVKLVFRDLPLSFHQNAHVEAQAANCARKQEGDEMYFKYHDLMFQKTTSNGTGLSEADLPQIAAELNLNLAEFQQCLDSGEFKEEVDKDLMDAENIGATGTPTFFVGKSSENGQINGAKITGAQPFSVFKQIIDQQLTN